MGWSPYPWHGHRSSGGGRASHIAHQVLGSRGVQHVVRHYSSGGGGGARGTARAVLGSRRIRRVVRQYQPQVVHSRLTAPSALQPPNVFSSRIGPLGFAPYQRAATNAVTAAVGRLPGRVRAPIIPQLDHYSRAQQHLIDIATTGYVRRAAAERGYQARGQGTGPLIRTLMRSDPQARQALGTFFRGGSAGAAAARDFRQQTMRLARRQGLNAAIGGAPAPQGGSPLGPVPRHQGRVSVDYGPPGVRGWNTDRRALQALRVALAGGNQATQAAAGRAQKAARDRATTTDAGAPWLRAINKLSAASRPGPVERAGMFAFGPQHNALAAVTSGLYKNSSAFRDVVNLPANTVSTGYNLGAGIFEKYVKGDPSRIRNIEAGLKRHDPVVLAVRSLVEGNPKLLKRAGFEARTHPLSTFLEVSGLGHGLARGAELGGRFGAARTLRQDVNAVAARTGPRLPRMGTAMSRGVTTFMPGTALRGRRRFSGHAAVRIVQRAHAERRAVQAKQLREQAGRMFSDARVALARRDAHTFDTLTKLSTETFAKANRIDPQHMSPHEVRQFVHEHHSAVEGVRRHGRAQATNLAHAATHPDHGAIQNLFLQGIVHLNKSDLTAYRTQLEAEATHLDGARLAANRATRAHLTKAINDPKFDPASIRAYAKAYRDHVQPMQDELVRAGMLDHAQAERRVLMPYAIRQMGARHAQEYLAPTRERLAQIGERTAALHDEFGQHVIEAQKLLTAAHEVDQGLQRGGEGFAVRYGIHPEWHRGEPVLNSWSVRDGLHDRIVDEGLTRHQADDLALRLESQHREAMKRSYLEQAQAEYAKGIPAQRELAALRDEATNGLYHEGLVGPDGQPLSDTAIRQHMLDPNVGGGRVNPDDLAYLPQTPEARGAVNYFRNWAQRETHRLGNQRFKGGATREGSLDIHPDVLKAHAANIRGLLDANAGYMDFYRHFGFRPHDERFQGSWADMKQKAADILATTGRDLKPIRLKPWGGSEEQLQQLLDHAAELHFDERGTPATPVQDALLRAIDENPGDKSGQFGLVDAAAADTLRGHLKVIDPSTGARMLQVLNQGFRRTVLPTSVRWLAGNVAEGALRTLIQHHFNPVSIVTDHMLMARALKQHDAFVDADVQMGRLSRTEGDRAKAMVRERTVGGGHMEMQAKTMMHRTADQFLQSGQTPKLVRAAALVMGSAGKAPGVRGVLRFVRWYSDAIMHSVNGRMESHIQMAQAGRAARLNLIDRRMPTVSQQAVQDLANGLRNTNAQVELGRIVDRAYGQYSKFDPTRRWLISAYTPFLPWTINAVRFLTQVLPADHPILSGLIAANVNAQADWIKATGMGPETVPSWLLGTYPLAGGAHMPLSRYTPFGVAGELPGSLLNLFAPQIMPLLRGWAGFDWKWQPVKGLNGWQDQFVYGVDQFMQANIPVYGPARAVMNRKEKGVLGKLGGWVNPATPYVQHSQGGDGTNGGVLGGGGGDSGSNGGVLKSLEAFHTPAGWVTPQQLQGVGALTAGQASRQAAPVRARALDTLQATLGAVASRRHFGGRPVGPMRFGPAGSPGNAGVQLASAEARFMSGSDFRGVPALMPRGKLARTFGPGTVGAVRTLFKQAPALVGQQVLAKVGQGLVPSGPLPSVQLRRFAQYGVKNSAGGVILPAPRAKAQIQSLSALGYGNGQIVSHLQSGTALKQLGPPAALVRAMRTLKGVKGVAPSGQKGVVYNAAKKFGIPPHVLWGVYGTESAFGSNPSTSTAGAQGPFQFLPSTADSYIAGGRANINNFKLAAEGAARYLKALGGQKNIVQALNNYNGNKGGSNPNTSYVQSVMGNSKKFGPVVHLNPAQKRAVAIAQRAAVAWQNVGSGGAGPVRAGIFKNAPRGRVDMGWDVGGAGPVAAFAPGKVTRSTTGSGWPGGGMITVKLDHPITTGGKTYKYMYYAENIAPQVRVGQHVKAGQALAHARGVYPLTEQGFANDAYGTTSSSAHGTQNIHPNHSETPEGQAFYNWVHSKAGKAAVNRKGGPRMSQLPRPIQRFLKRYAPVAPRASGGVSSGGSASSGGVGSSSSGGGGGSSAGGGGAAGSSAGLAALIKSLAGGSVPVSSALTAPWFATGPALVQTTGPARRKKSYV